MRENTYSSWSVYDAYLHAIKYVTMQMKQIHISNNYFKSNNAATVNWLYILSRIMFRKQSSTTIFSPQSAQASKGG